MNGCPPLRILPLPSTDYRPPKRYSTLRHMQTWSFSCQGVERVNLYSAYTNDEVAVDNGGDQFFERGGHKIRYYVEVCFIETIDN